MSEIVDFFLGARFARLSEIVFSEIVFSKYKTISESEIVFSKQKTISDSEIIFQNDKTISDSEIVTKFPKNYFGLRTISENHSKTISDPKSLRG